MATNTFSTVREPQFRPRPKASYTLRQVMIQTIRWFGGSYGMTGWIRDIGGTPQARRVYLSVWPYKTLIAVTESDPNNVGNNYFFNGLQLLDDSNESYVLSVHDVDQIAAPRIKDNRIPV